MVRAFLFLLVWFWAAPLALAEVELLEWRPEGYDYSFVIPQRKGETPAAALERYLKALEANPSLAGYGKVLRVAGTGTLAPYADGPGPAVLAVANDLDDLTAAPRRMHKVLDPLAERGAKALLTPVAVTTGLSEKDAADFRLKVSARFDGLVSVGGDDIHPSLYSDPDPKGLAVDTNLARDVEEMKLVRTYLDEGKGMFSGICRGHQMGGVATSCPLVKDIREELALDHPRGRDHGLALREGEAGPLTRQVFDGNSSIVVNSYHHQAVKIPAKPSPLFRVTAVAADQPSIAEIAEYYAGRGLSVQAHPEDMTSSAFHARFYDVLYGEVDRAHSRRVSRPLRRIDLGKTLFGVEYTFQDQAMVDEPGRMTMVTPHKEGRLAEFRAAYLRELGLPADVVSAMNGFKAGSFIDVPGDGRHVMNMEPVTIEVNTTPKKFDEIEAAAEKIYRASEKAALVPYVNPAAERSGMGHIHVGAKTIGESPFYQHPHLLRNMMVYIQKHPSLLWGFAEAYDIDGAKLRSGTDATNIETYHKPGQQKAFGRVVEKFDAWYEKTRASGGDLNDGLRQFLRFLKEEEAPGVEFFRHYRFMNLEHLKAVANSPAAVDPAMAGKYTVEFRNFRPPRTPGHAKAHAELLLALMEKLSEPGHLEKFEPVSPGQYDRFHSATRVAGDWETVKRALPRYNPLWDDSVGEYVRVQHGRGAIRAALPQGLKAEIYSAYSPKVEKGTKFEIRLPVESYDPPKVALAGNPLEFERVAVDGKEYWVATFDVSREGPGLTVERMMQLGGRAECAQWFSVVR